MLRQRSNDCVGDVLEHEGRWRLAMAREAMMDRVVSDDCSHDEGDAGELISNVIQGGE